MVDEKMIKHQGRKAEKNYFCVQITMDDGK